MKLINMMMKQYQPFYILSYSPWPIIISMNLIGMFINFINWLNLKNPFLLMFSSMILFLISILWWRDIIRESSFMGNHTFKIYIMLKWSMILFIISEVFFFISFFWNFFNNSIIPNYEFMNFWPPKSILPFNFLEIPLLNTIILLTSGIFITWSHYALINKNHFNMIISLTMTVILGMYFTMLQIFEYFQAKFNFFDSIYGSSFFIATGFHGVHVIIGSLFLLSTLIRQSFFFMSSSHHFNFEAASWYWHFVDVIWLFLYLSIYWWGS
uniref:Cytochrome c oxidase subunit 3 n=1 Tax=Mengenilla moldrzyki TaxID=1155016 RepID=J3RYF5_MENMO|nr:cytochrome c oxidase subunit III [Mengenilla moldrzyki]AFC35464.1 cytochrome c oxidase subunit III [Mengenilla moldrzyki]